LSEKRITFWILTVLVVVTLVCGLVGWRAHGAAPGVPMAWDAALYRTLLAFSGDGIYLEASLGPWLATARLSGILVTISAVLALAMLFLGTQLKRTLASQLRGAQVVIGASDFALDDALRRGRTVVYDRPEKLAALTLRPPLHRALLVPDRLAGKWPLRAIGGAPPFGAPPRRIVFGDADAIVNVERARQWLCCAPARLREATEIVLRIEDNAVARDFALIDEAFARVRVISRSEAIARAFVTALAPAALARARGQRCIHMVLFELGDVGLAIVEELVLRCHLPGIEALHLTIVSADCDAARARMRAERPDLLDREFLREHIFLHWLDMDARQVCAQHGGKSLFALEGRVAITAMVVAAGEDRHNIGLGMRLRQVQREQQRLRAPIFVLDTAFPAFAPLPGADLSGGIRAFGGRAPASADDDVEAVYEELARETHETWRRGADVGRRVEERWEALSTAKRRASYRTALSAIEIFQGAGLLPPIPGTIAGLRLHPEAVRLVQSDPALMTALARSEHHRWNAERLADGWRPARGRGRDDERKIHPLMVRFEELPAEQPIKDLRNVAQALDMGLARHAAAADLPCWRPALRIGVIGPLEVAQDRLLALETAFAALFDAPPLDAFAQRTLEILTPNAPGFDRVAVPALLKVWAAQTGREGRVLCLDVAQKPTVDAIAAEFLLQTPGRHPAGLKKQMQDQSLALEAAAGPGLMHVDMRPLGISNADLMADRDLYFAGILAVQEQIIAQADLIVFHLPQGRGGLTRAALERWRATGRPCIVLP